MPKRIYDKTVRELFDDLVAEVKLKPGETISRTGIGDWFKKKYPKIKPATVYCHCIRLSTNAPDRVHCKADQDDDVFFRVERGQFRLYDPKTDPPPIYVKGEAPPPPPPPVDEESEQEFAYEKDLQQFLAKNLEFIEPGLKLYKDEEDPNITGIEFPTEDRRIDILANSTFSASWIKSLIRAPLVAGPLTRSAPSINPCPIVSPSRATTAPFARPAPAGPWRNC